MEGGPQRSRSSGAEAKGGAWRRQVGVARRPSTSGRPVLRWRCNHQGATTLLRDQSSLGHYAGRPSTRPGSTATCSPGQAPYRGKSGTARSPTSSVTWHRASMSRNCGVHTAPCQGRSASGRASWRRRGAARRRPASLAPASWRWPRRWRGRTGCAFQRAAPRAHSSAGSRPSWPRTRCIP